MRYEEHRRYSDDYLSDIRYGEPDAIREYVQGVIENPNLSLAQIRDHINKMADKAELHGVISDFDVRERLLAEMRLQLHYHDAIELGSSALKETIKQVEGEHIEEEDLNDATRLSHA